MKIRPILLLLVLLFVASAICSWANSSESIFPDLPDHLKGTTTPDGRFRVYFSPQDMPIEAVKAHLSLAQKSITIATYNFSISDYAGVLNEAAQRGVRVEFMVDYKLSFKNKVWPELLNHENIKKTRLPVWKGSAPQMHNKIIIIDDKLVLTGSANYSYFGLAANYENIMAIQDVNLISKFLAEIEEMMSIAKLTRRLFSVDGSDAMIDPVHSYLTQGKFPEYAIDPDYSHASELTGKKGIFNEINLPKHYDILNAFKDSVLREKMKQFIDGLAQIERYVDGSLTSSDPDFLNHASPQEGKFKVFFSPEDNVEKQIVSSLKQTLEDPQNSFAYISTNFITNPRIAKTLKQLANAGVRMRVSFDKGRFEDDLFKYQLDQLSFLGFYGDPTIIEPRLRTLGIQNKARSSDYSNSITIFDNQLTGPFGCNHNKMAVVGTPEGVTLLNGSANWSSSAMKRNGENLVITSDEYIVSIYLREILSQLFVYRYEQNERSTEFWDEVNYFCSKVSSLNTVLGRNDSFEISDGNLWQPNALSCAIISVSDVPANPDDFNVWVWVPQLNDNRGGAMRLYTNSNYAGKWLTSIPVPPKWHIKFKFFIAEKEYNPNEEGLQQNHIVRWESGDDRKLIVAPLAVHVIRDHYQFRH